MGGRARFAHIADVHLGAFREPALREANLEAFLNAMDACEREAADFVLVCGDLFHSSLPDIGVVERATARMRALAEADVPIYIIYGSHDFSAAERSMVDVLHSAGVFTKVARAEGAEDGSVTLGRTVDRRTGAVIAGLSGRKLGLDRAYYERLDASAALDGPGPKIFAFHAAIAELKPRELAEMEAMPVSLLPRGFDYYAGGHVHRRALAEIPGWGLVAYPGPLFGDTYRDLESGEERGFYVVELEEGRRPQVRFHPIPSRRTVRIEIDASGRAPGDVSAELRRRAEEAEAGGAIVLVKVHGELESGRASEVNTQSARGALLDAGAFTVYVNRSGLTTKEKARARVEAGGSREETEERILREHLSGRLSALPGLGGEEGVKRALRLLRALERERPGGTEDEKREDALLAVEELLLGWHAGGEKVGGAGGAGGGACPGREGAGEGEEGGTEGRGAPRVREGGMGGGGGRGKPPGRGQTTLDRVGEGRE